ncbi:MerR family transcriptional regulator [Bacillus sp. JCM 19041]|uniref:MerR family transcriptional regulator n=1 Tax=Bacillus sp. JCM 19041 TaxID=1460637 RepID=UPI0006D07330
MYTIGKLSKKTGVTVRTLDYYDQISLLSPKEMTEGGHRLYSDHDVMRLEQILALKYMGFPLDKVKQLLHETDWRTSVLEQLDMVRAEKRRLELLEQALEGFIMR